MARQEQNYIELSKKGLLYGVCASLSGVVLLYFLGSVLPNLNNGVINTLGLFSWLLMMVGIIVVLISGVTWFYQAVIKSLNRSET